MAELSSEQRRVDVDAVRPDDELEVFLAGRDGPLVTTLRLALGPWTRLRGLIGGAPLADGEGLLLRPCSGIHTFFMGYAIDALFVDRAGEVLSVAADVRPWRMVPMVAGARATLELRAGACEAAGGVDVGDRIVIARPRVRRCDKNA